MLYHAPRRENSRSRASHSTGYKTTKPEDAVIIDAGKGVDHTKSSMAQRRVSRRRYRWTLSIIKNQGLKIPSLLLLHKHQSFLIQASPLIHILPPFADTPRLKLSTKMSLRFLLDFFFLRNLSEKLSYLRAYSGLHLPPFLGIEFLALRQRVLCHLVEAIESV